MEVQFLPGAQLNKRTAFVFRMYLWYNFPMQQGSLRRMAAALRAAGKTYTEIQKELGKTVPKSTLFYWCRNVALPSEYAEKIKLMNEEALRRGRAIALVTKRNKRIEYLNLIRIQANITKNRLTPEADKLALAMLYLGEGSKWRSHPGLMLGNSDQDIIIIYLTLLKKVYNIEPSILKCRISYRADQNIDELQGFWSRITGIPLKNFYKTKPDPRTVGKKTANNDYRGVCVIMGGSTKIQLELETLPKILFLGR